MQQQSNLVSGYQRARSKLAIECSIFITLRLPVCPVPLKSFSFGRASRALRSAGQPFPGCRGGSWHPWKCVRMCSSVLVCPISFWPEKRATERTSRTCCASGGRAAWFRLVPGTRWWSCFKVSRASLLWLSSAGSSSSFPGAGMGVEESPVTALVYIALIYIVNLCGKPLVASGHECVWIWHRWCIYACSILMPLTS